MDDGFAEAVPRPVPVRRGRDEGRGHPLWRLWVPTESWAWKTQPLLNVNSNVNEN